MPDDQIGLLGRRVDIGRRCLHQLRPLVVAGQVEAGRPERQSGLQRQRLVGPGHSKPHDRVAESPPGKLTATELIVESGLRRDVVYEHDKTARVVENFTARVKTRNAVPEAMQQLADDNHRLKKEFEEARAALAQERGKTKVLLRVATELSLELDQVREELVAAQHVTRLPARTGQSGSERGRPARH